MAHPSWACVCGEMHISIQAWVACYGSHLRRGGYVVIPPGKRDRGSAALWEHPDGGTRNYPPMEGKA
jgi:hypothetical protein